MTFLELYGSRLDTELATADRTQLFTTARRQEAVQAAMRDFVRLTRCTTRQGTITITDGVEEYGVYTTLTDWVSLDGAPSIRITESGGTVRYIQGADQFPRRTTLELDRLSPGWRTAPDGTPECWYLRDDGNLYLGMSPGPDISGSDVWVWLVPYVANPTALSADADVPFTVGGTVMLRLTEYHQALVHFAAAQLEPLRKNYTEATRQMQLYTGYVAQYLQDQRQHGHTDLTLARNYLGESQARRRPSDPRR